METSALGASNPFSSASSSGLDSLRDVGVDDFLKMLIAELQNQDPLNPTDNNQILQQVGQIRNIQSTSQLTETLQSVLLGQNLSSASNLINKQIHGLTADGKNVEGRVERVTIEDGTPRLIVGANSLSLSSVREILSE